MIPLDIQSSIPESDSRYVATQGTYGFGVAICNLTRSDTRHGLELSVARFKDLTQTSAQRKRVALHLSRLEADR